MSSWSSVDTLTASVTVGTGGKNEAFLCHGRYGFPAIKERVDISWVFGWFCWGQGVLALSRKQSYIWGEGAQYSRQFVAWIIFPKSNERKSDFCLAGHRRREQCPFTLKRTSRVIISPFHLSCGLTLDSVSSSVKVPVCLFVFKYAS